MPKESGDPSKKAADAGDGKRSGPESPSSAGAQRLLMAPRSARDVGGGSSTNWPVLKRTNYNSWSMLMKVILQVRHLWDIIDPGEGDYDDNRAVLEAVLRVVPPEMILMLAIKKMAKEAWDAIKTIRVGADRVREAKARNFRKKYEDLRLKPGESVDDFGLRLQELVHQLDIHDDPIDDKKVIHIHQQAKPIYHAFVHN